MYARADSCFDGFKFDMVKAIKRYFVGVGGELFHALA